MIQTYENVNVTSVADSTAVANTATETVIIPDWSCGPNFFYQGKKARCSLWGVISNVVTAVPTITFFVRVGTATLSATWASQTGALACNATANTNLVWHGEIEMVCRSVGAAGTGMVQGQFWLPNLTAGNALGNVGYPNMLPVSAPAAGTLNTGVTNIVSVSAKWSAASASNSITVNQGTWEEMN